MKSLIFAIAYLSLLVGCSGKLEGVQTTWHDNGQKAVEAAAVDDLDNDQAAKLLGMIGVVVNLHEVAAIDERLTALEEQQQPDDPHNRSLPHALRMTQIADMTSLAPTDFPDTAGVIRTLASTTSRAAAFSPYPLVAWITKLFAG
jgi:hypothetical protein